MPRLIRPDSLVWLSAIASAFPAQITHEVLFSTYALVSTNSIALAGAGCACCRDEYRG